jgi:hypothetical protein
MFLPVLMSYQGRQADRTHHQILSVKLIGSAEVVDDLGNRLSSLGMAHVVRELMVLDHRSILVFASRRS